MIFQYLTLLCWAGITVVTYFLARNDIKTHRVPNKINLAIAIGSVVPIVLECLVPGAVVWKVIVSHLCGGIFAFGLMLVAALVSKGGFGGGDIKLLGALGLWYGVFSSLGITFLSAIAYLGFIAYKRTTMAKQGKEPPKVFPYVPFVFIATLVTTVITAIVNLSY